MAHKLTSRELKALTSELQKIGILHFEIFLFGSTAKGEAKAHSDRDFCIVVPNGIVIDLDKAWIAVLTAALGMKGFNFDIILTTKNEFKNNKISPILHQVRISGKKVLEA